MAGSSLSFAADWKSSLAEALSAKYEITKVGLDRERITKAGTILVLRNENVVGALATDPAILTNKVVNGVVQQASGFMAAMLSKSGSHQQPVPDPGSRSVVIILSMKSYWTFK